MHDIMWSYGEEFAADEGFDQSTLSTIDSEFPSDEEEGEKRDTSVSDVLRRVQRSQLCINVYM